MYLILNIYQISNLRNLPPRKNELTNVFVAFSLKGWNELLGR